MMLNDYWEFNVMGVYDYRSYGSLYDWYEIIQSNIRRLRFAYKQILKILSEAKMPRSINYL